MNPQTILRSSNSRVGGAVKPALAAVLALGLIAIVLIARGVLRSHYEETKFYASAASIPAHNGLFVLPDWAPQDATNIEINVQTQGKGRSLSLQTDSTTVPTGCVASPRPVADPVPALNLGSTTGAKQGYRCGEWFVVRDDNDLLAWTAYRNA